MFGIIIQNAGTTRDRYEPDVVTAAFNVFRGSSRYARKYLCHFDGQRRAHSRCSRYLEYFKFYPGWFGIIEANFWNHLGYNYLLPLLLSMVLHVNNPLSVLKIRSISFKNCGYQRSLT